MERMSKEMTPSHVLMDQAIRRYRDGSLNVAFELLRSDGHIEVFPVHRMSDWQDLDIVERIAINRCKGSVLDVGAGMGRHARNLVERGLDVTALDISEQCVHYLNEIGIANAHTLDARFLPQARYDTVLMLGNGLGMLGSIEEVERFMSNLNTVLADGGRLLCDSVDMLVAQHDPFMKIRRKNAMNGRHEGEVQFRIKYDDTVGEPFTWLFLTEDELLSIASSLGLSCEVLHKDDSGKFLVEVSQSSDAPERVYSIEDVSSELNAFNGLTKPNLGPNEGHRLDELGYLVVPEILPRDMAELVSRYATLRLSTGGHFTEDKQTGCPSRYGDPLCETFLDYLQPRIEGILNKKLLPTYSYMRFYSNGSELRRHKDRNACEISLTITLSFESERIWPIWLETGGVPKEVCLDVGDAMIYKGIDVPHWREPFPGERWLQMFLHYVVAEGVHSSEIFDGRRGIGL